MILTDLTSVVLGSPSKNATIQMASMIICKYDGSHCMILRDLTSVVIGRPSKNATIQMASMM